MKFTLKEMNGLLNGKCLPSDLLVGETLADYLIRKFDDAQQQLAESHRALRAETTAHDHVKNQLEKMAAENVGLNAFVDALLSIAWNGCSTDGAEIQELALKHGLLRQETYSADEHENQVNDPGNFEDGDPVYFRVETPATDAFLAEIKTAIEYPKNNSSSNGWTIDPEFLSRVEERAGAVYGYYPGLEETEAALLAGMDLLRERAAQ